MCGRYYVDEETYSEIQQVILDVEDKLNRNKWNRDINPTDKAPVIVQGKKGMKLVEQSFGYIGKDVNVINARSETLQEKPMFKNGLRYHRAVIPATHFYEWNSNKEKNTFSREDKQVLYFAGLYDMMDNEPHFVIVTTEANESMEPVHNRMPLILEKNQISDWINDEKCALKLLKQKPVELNRHAEYEQLSLWG